MYFIVFCFLLISSERGNHSICPVIGKKKEEFGFRLTDTAQALFVCVTDYRSSWSAGVSQLWCLVLGTAQPELVGEETDHLFGCSKAKGETHPHARSHTHIHLHTLLLTQYKYFVQNHSIFSL